MLLLSFTVSCTSFLHRKYCCIMESICQYGTCYFHFLYWAVSEGKLFFAGTSPDDWVIQLG